MSGTDVTRVNIDLASTIGGSAGDGQADTVTILGTNGADAINVRSSAAEIVVWVKLDQTARAAGVSRQVQLKIAAPGTAFPRRKALGVFASGHLTI
jgi:hypothetical protein